MDRFFGIIGIFTFLLLAFLMSNNRKAINYRLVGVGLLLQISMALFILKTDIGKGIFGWIAQFISKILDFSDQGAQFVFGVLVNKAVLSQVLGSSNAFIFFFKIIPTIIFVAVLVNIAYHLGIMQRVVSFFAWIVNKLMGASGSEALSNVGSIFVGQVEAQIMIKPYVKGMTKSELLASMSGSMACIAGGVMAVYISMGVPAQYLLAASLMAAPGALVISKIVYPETEESQTKGSVTLKIEKNHANLMDAISHGASDGLKISLNVIAMLLGFIALIAMIDAGLGWMGELLGIPLNLTLVLGTLFSGFAYIMGVPSQDIQIVGGLMGKKMVINEFVAYSELVPIMNQLNPKSLVIVSFALCGFANFSSIAIQVGGIGEIAPSRRSDLAALGFKAMICGTLASYMSATIAGILS
ncbi:MAG: nucleoside permease [Bacteroidia bacterium]|nr:MAG: nucleoside permease [Bacteroidia bacterium]